MKTERVRFAPSPTGWLHVGGARTALFNWLYAKKHDGKLILRIEDTDLDRSQEKYTEGIKEDLKWLGIVWDEFYKQSDRLEIYERYARRLVHEEKAYHCFCTEEELEERRQKALDEGRTPTYDGRCRNLSEEEKQEYREEGRDSVIRFKLPEQQPSVVVPDRIKGDVEFESLTTGDFVILKSDGTPSYNFACVLDDHLMEISFTMRAEDHLTNTAKQILLYDALDFNQPQFGHLSMLLGPDKSKLSKRSGATSVKEFKKNGYLPEALVNHLAQLGWSSKDNQEIFSVSELTEKFSLDNIIDSPQVFDREKLDWFNNQYIKRAELDRLVGLSVPLLKERGYIEEEPEEDGREKLKKVLDLIRPSLEKLTDLKDHEDLEIFYGSLELNSEAKEVLNWDGSTAVLEALEEKFSTREFLSSDEVSTIVKEVKEDLEVEYKEVYKPLRAAVTGKISGPEIKEVLSILGPEVTCDRLNTALESLE
ncbi:MAG: glutamate--tRNA ligase [Candidatus Bipolaricaulota bacterium]|nr:glutamate--tRNA ligase [Candidatus Bipolaricaulota bacterium]MBS3791869.1 glutamate--tRNA ligase [Candidatus Bipolaricaulota bacterium]